MNEAQVKKLFEEFQKSIEEKFKSFQKSINDQLEIILKRQAGFQKSLDTIDHDMGNDRVNIDDIKRRQGSIDTQFEEFRHMFGNQTKKIQETVQDAVSDRVEPVSSQVEELKQIMTTEGGD